jgi:hypothetical protein
MREGGEKEKQRTRGRNKDYFEVERPSQTYEYSRRAHEHGPLTGARTRLKSMKVHVPQQAINATDPIRCRKRVRGGHPRWKARRDTRRARSSDDGDMLGRHVRELVRTHILVQVRHERAKHVPAAHPRRVARLHWPAPSRVASNRTDPQRAARWPRRRLRVIRRGHRDRGGARPRTGEEDRVGVDAEVP